MSKFILLKLTASDCGVCVRLKSNWDDTLVSQIENNDIKVISYESPSLSNKIQTELIPHPILRFCIVFPLLMIMRRSYWDYLFSHPDAVCDSQNVFILGPYLNNEGHLNRDPNGRVSVKFQPGWDFSSAGILKWSTDIVKEIPLFQAKETVIVSSSVKAEEITFCSHRRIKRRK